MSGILQPMMASYKQRTYATWNPSLNGVTRYGPQWWNGSAWVTPQMTWNLSNNNLTATSSTVNGNWTSNFGCFLDASIYLAEYSGKWYCELTFASSAPDEPIFGVMLTGHDTGSYLGYDLYSVSYYGGYLYSNGATVSGQYNGQIAAGDVVGLAIDRSGAYTSNTCSVYVNNVFKETFNIAAAQTGTVAIDNNWRNGKTITANFGASPFVYTPPTGYNPGIYTTP